MSLSIIEQVFMKKQVASAVSNALRRIHHRNSSAVKEISRKIGVNPLTVSNWYRSANAPNAQHLVNLMMIYPEVFLEIMGLVNGGNPGDRNVTSKIQNSDAFDEIFNKRQLWFLIMLSSGAQPTSKKISDYWQVSHRTAKRDIAGIVQRKIIIFQGPKNRGSYEFVSGTESHFKFKE